MKRDERPPKEPPSEEIDLHGLIADEALFRLERYLNEAFMSGLIRVRVVHGKGTGTLRQVVREMLGDHPLVEEYFPAEPREGGGGATIVVLVRY
ncbi:MAG: Smr/MutS family protein [Chloroflexota bacterium]|nr:Smr/MutS family protein [Chloroflexota bacterium]